MRESPCELDDGDPDLGDSLLPASSPLTSIVESVLLVLTMSRKSWGCCWRNRFRGMADEEKVAYCVSAEMVKESLPFTEANGHKDRHSVGPRSARVMNSQ